MVKRILSILVLIQFGLAQTTIFAAREIEIAGSHAIQVPPFSYFGEAQCDRSGNLYFHGGDSDFRYGQVFRLSSDGKSGSLFRLTGDFADPNRYGFDSFWVTAEGGVFILSTDSQDKYVFTFDRDGTMKNPIRLKVRAEVQLTDFAIFDNGFIFVWGYNDEHSLKDLRGKRYAAILSDSGEFVREVSIPLPGVDLGNLGAPSDGAAASYAGNLYFMGSDQIVVISPAGEIIRRIKVHKPETEDVATKLYLSDGMAVIALNKISTKGSTRGQVQRSFIAVDPSSGELMGHYKAGVQLGGDVCFNRNDGLTFLQSDGKTQKLATAVLR